MNILVSIDKNYIRPLIIMLYSLIKNNGENKIVVYLMNTTLEKEDFAFISSSLSNKLKLIDIKVHDFMLSKAPVSTRFPVEMYYRIFASKYLPKQVDRILYLDPDLIVDKNLSELYRMEFKGNYYIACSHVNKALNTFNNIRLKTKGNPYINSGVLLINVKLLRKEQKINEVYEFIKKNKIRLFLPDQEIISSLYGKKILLVSTYKYNMTEKLAKEESLRTVDTYSRIIHYCGKNKPWNEEYHGKLDVFYKRYEQEVFMNR